MPSSNKINTIAVVFIAAAALIAASAIYRRLRRRRIAGGRRCCSDSNEKPQNRFKRVLADNSYSPFKHYKRDGKEKEISLKVHPYEEEITSLLEHPPNQVEFITSHEYSAMDHPYVWIHTKDQLEFLARLLGEKQAFAVDTEQHSLRSFLGFTALMQISTQKEDFLLDTIALHDAMGILRPVFADPSICKVFHGADNDVLWLQRDFHIYVVNMFDTAKACEVLSKPQKSLAYLLETYCGVTTDKTFQREDWRLRPLSAEMIQYARTDAHYLLYISDCLASELGKDNPGMIQIAGAIYEVYITNHYRCMGYMLRVKYIRDYLAYFEACLDDKFNLLFEATRRSNMVCMQLYAKETESSPGASAAASIYSRNLHVQEFTPSKISEIKELLWKLCAWRDLMARIHDESLRYVLSDQAIVALATKVPKDPIEAFDIIQEADMSTDSSNIAAILSTPSPIVSTHANELCFLLQEVDVNIHDVLKRYLNKHLVPTGCCPMSIFNYALLSEFSLKQTNTIFSKLNGGRFNTPVSKKASRELFVQKFSCKSPVYHNCRIYANDGRLLCYCDRRKLEWYLRRELATIVEDDPPAIMLLFEPKGRPEDEGNDFYIQSKKNICVGCGEKDHYLRYRIIPSCYRMHFPEHLKSHRSHDIVLLCVDCHEIAHSAAEKYKRQVAAEFEIPLFVRKIVDSGEHKAVNLTSISVDGVKDTGVSPLHLRTAAMALLRHGSTMPSNRRDELTQIVKTYFGGREITAEDLEMALLVGMSPHEMRRLEKKKGLKLKRYNGNSFQIHAQTNESDINLSSDAHNSNESSEDGDVNDIDNEQRNTSMNDTDADRLPGANEDASLASGGEQSFDRVETLNMESDFILNPADENGGNYLSSRSQEVLSFKGAKKLSLLGHGPHGKQVVEHLLNNYGEDGIIQFCQKWRQVFVEAVHPRFLPPGWDIMHSGRREFGDYSVYSPVKRATEMTIN